MEKTEVPYLPSIEFFMPHAIVVSSSVLYHLRIAKKMWKKSFCFLKMSKITKNIKKDIFVTPKSLK
jgi:hypothetical protein